MVEGGFALSMSNDDFIAWTEHTRSSDAAVHIDIVRNVSLGTPKVAGKTVLPGTNTTFSDIGSNNCAVLPNETSALFGWSTGYYFIDFSNPASIVNTYVNFSGVIPNIRSVQAINILKDNVTVIFSYLTTSYNLAFQEGIIQPNGSIALARNYVIFTGYSTMIYGTAIDNVRNILYVQTSIQTDLQMLNITSFTVALQFTYQGPPFFGSTALIQGQPWISADGLTACLSVAGGNFILNTTNIGNIKIINSYSRPSTLSSNWCALRADQQVGFGHSAYLFNASLATSPINTIRSYST